MIRYLKNVLFKCMDIKNHKFQAQEHARQYCLMCRKPQITWLSWKIDGQHEKYKVTLWCSMSI